MFLATGSEQVTSTTVPGFTGNCVVVSSLFSHSVGSPVQTPANDEEVASDNLQKRPNLSNIYHGPLPCLFINKSKLVIFNN